MAPTDHSVLHSVHRVVNVYASSSSLGIIAASSLEQCFARQKLIANAKVSIPSSQSKLLTAYEQATRGNARRLFL